MANFCDNESVQAFIGIPTITALDDVASWYEVLCPMLLFACILGVLLNFALILISHLSSKSPLLRLSLHLAATDAMASLISATGITLNSYLPVVFQIHVNSCLALINETLRLTSFMASSLHLLALAFIHYRGVTSPLQNR